MFKPVTSQRDFIELENEILDFWREHDTFNELRKLRKDGPRWSFIDGPITANNPMGIHHGWGRTYKDLFHRFYAMLGHEIRYQNGFDCQGLWVEVNVEREKGFKSKRDIEEFGLAEFVLLCKQRVLNFAAVQTEQSIRLGYWMDWNDPQQLTELSRILGENSQEIITVDGPLGEVTGTVEHIVGLLGLPEMGGSYFTFSNENNYTIWSALKSCHERGWIYKGTDVMPWCGRCGTGLSQHEIVTEGYQEITHPSITLKFPLIEQPGESLLVWTTTPWTLTSNVAAAVGPELIYVRVRQGEEIYVLSKGALSMLVGEFELMEEFPGSTLEGKRYKGPFDELPAQIESGAPEAHRVILWDEVGEEEGTGIVHIAPGAGAEDYALGKEYGLPVIAPLDESGVFIQGFGRLSRIQVGESAEKIFQDLEDKNLVYKIQDYTHRYPVCWRCGEELVFRLVEEWFISMGQQLDKPYEEVTEEEKKANLRYQMMEVVINETRWYPSFGFERELDWLRNMHDWMISKKRYWGLALPIYECQACGQFEVIGSREELKERAVEGWEVFDGHTPHRPHIDAVKIECSQCGKIIHRIADVGNPWLDAGVVAMSTLGYKDDRSYWERWFPADLISESFPGQFRNWFYSLLAMSTILERRAPFRNVFTYATVLAEDGRAMHKSWGNAIEFNEAADQIGVDVMRWLYCDHKPEKDLLFGYHRSDEVRRQFLLPIWNVYSFFVTYANIDSWNPNQERSYELSELDRWILARLNEVISSVTDNLRAFEPNMATAAVNEFIDDLSNWYLRRSRRRFWAKTGASEASDADKNAAYQTLYTVLTNLIKILAPFVPFVTEEIYQNLVRAVNSTTHASVHHCDWPTVDPIFIDETLTRHGSLVKRLVSLGHAARNQANRKLRQPLAEAAFHVRTKEEAKVVERNAVLIAAELNVKCVRLLDTVSEAVNLRLNPLPKQLGRKYGALFPKIRQQILNLPDEETEKAALKITRGEPIEVTIDDQMYQINPDEVEVRIEAHEGFSAAADGPYVTALDTTLTPELEMEGMAREFVRRVQDLRKQSSLRVDDRIRLYYEGSEILQEAISNHQEYILEETLSESIQEGTVPSRSSKEEYKIGDEHLRIGLERL